MACTDTLGRLMETILARKGADSATSYVAALFVKGSDSIIKKFGEEAFELAVASAQKDHAKTVSETADVLFHLLVLLAEQGVSLEEVMQELQRREGVSGIAEKHARSN